MPSYVLQFEERCHRYTVNGKFTPSVTQVLEAAGLIDLEGIPTHILRRAADRGTQVHKAGALLLRNNLEWSSVDEAIGGYVRALDSFLRHTGFRAKPEFVETPLYCAQYDFCGTPDALGIYSFSRRFGRVLQVMVVLDWKTGMMCAVRLQLAAYAHALGVRHRAAVKLNDDGTYSMQWFGPETQRHDLDTFLRALEQTRNDGRWAA